MLATSPFHTSSDTAFFYPLKIAFSYEYVLSTFAYVWNISVKHKSKKNQGKYIQKEKNKGMEVLQTQYDLGAGKS